jgi:chemotaxis regulatin CheY-phosphate phosphatase CheZ
MKTISRLVSLALLAAAFALPVFAQDPAASPAAAQNPCEEAARTEMYTDYYNSKKGDAAAQKHARDVAGQYMQKYGSCNDQYTKAVQKFIDIYDQAAGSFNLQKKLTDSYANKQFPDAVAAAKEMLAKNPDDVRTAIFGAWAAYQGVVAKNTALAPDALTLAQKALQLLQAGKTAENYFFNSKEEAQDWMEYVLGAANLKDNPTEAAKHLVAVAQSNSSAKQEPTTYYLLANAYQDEWQKLKTKYDAIKEVNDESKILLANMNLAVDRIIDAYARAVAFSTKPEQQAAKAAYLKTLTDIYKDQHGGSDAGLNELIASVGTKPLLITTPVTTAPVDAPAAGTGDGANGTKPPTTATPMTTPATAPQPKPTPTPAKKPPVHNPHG